MRRVSPMAFACAATLALHGAGALAQTLTPRSNLQNTLPPRPSTPPDSTGRAQVAPRAPTTKEVRADTRVHVTEVRIAGVRSIPFAEVSGVFRRFVGTDTTAGDLVKAADSVGGHYSDHGYALSYAYLPEQDFANGVVQVVAVEGFIDHLELQGAPAHIEDRIRAVIAPVLHERPLTTRTFERSVSLLARLPDVSVDANVPVPEGDDGASPLELKIRQRRFTASAAFDADHPGFEGLLTGSVNGLTRWGDRLNLSVMAPRGSRDRSYDEIDELVPLGNDGLALHANAYRYRARPFSFDANGGPVRQDYSEQRVIVGLAYPFVLDRRNEVTGEADAFAARSGDLFTQPPLPGRIDNRATTRGLQASLQGTFKRDKSETGIGVQVAKGFACCGAKQDLPTVDLDYLKVQVSGRRSDTWGKDAFGTFFSAVVQHSPDFLPGTERISFGGNYFGAGYPTGELSGDSGYGVSAEINKPFRRQGFLKRVEPYLGMDYAKAWLNGLARPDALMSAVVGVRFDAGRHVTLSLGRARPVGARPFGEDGRPWRWNVQLSARFD